MSSRHHIDDFMRGRIIGNIEEGRKITDVAKEFDIALFHGCGSHLKLLECVVDGTGEVVLETPTESGTAYHPENIQEKNRYPTCSIMVWAGIMINGRTHLHVVANGTMTGQRYIDEVLLPHVCLFLGAVGDKFVFMDDNAKCHRTLAVQDCLDSKGIQRLVWPARSPDLTPSKMCRMLWGGKFLVETILRQTRTPSSVHSQRNGINCLNSCWIMLCKVFVECCITLHGGHIPY
ncbi:transposable element Tc1 transposase [Trichonephila clavipes]|nr:transposable element Tc1 transposase [Trichonephila clavipes]